MSVRARQHANARPVPPPLRISHFIRFFGSARYFNPALWPTMDGIIPWKRFLLEYQFMWSTMALERVSLARGFGHVMGEAEKAKEGRMDDFDEAFL